MFNPAFRQTHNDRILTSPIFTFLIGEDKTEFKVHSSAIAKQSDALHALINQPMAEAASRTVVMKDVNCSTFVRFCRFAYTGDYEAVKKTDPTGKGKTREMQSAKVSAIQPPQDEREGSRLTKRKRVTENGSDATVQLASERRPFLEENIVGNSNSTSSNSQSTANPVANSNAPDPNDYLKHTPALLRQKMGHPGSQRPNTLQTLPNYFTPSHRLSANLSR
jgi:hypothetical protein